MTCERRDDTGAYVLHALSEDEASAFQTHLAGCAACRADVAALRTAVDVLPAAVPEVAPPSQLRERIMREVRSEAELLGAPAPARRRWHRRPLLATAAAAACALVAVAIAVRDDDGPATRTLAAQVTAPGAAATLHVTGDRAALRVRGMPSPARGDVYQVWLVKRDGRPRPTDTLFDVRDGRASVEIDGSLDGVEQILVSAEPSGGSSAPTSAPVITATPS